MQYKGLLCFMNFMILLTFYKGEAQTWSNRLEEKVQRLTEMTATKPIISLNANKFKVYVKSPPRDYSFIVMFTALSPARRCVLCQLVYDEYLTVAQSFRLSAFYNNKLFFGNVDFDNGVSDIFQRLQLRTAPLIVHFPAKGRPTTMNWTIYGLQAEAIAKFVQDKTYIKIPIPRPSDYSEALSSVMLLVLVASFLCLRRNNLEFLYNDQMWAVSAVFFCFAMVSGQMWNQINGTPLYHKAADGYVYIMTDDLRTQFVLESYVIGILNMAVVVGMILMIEAAGGVKNSDPDQTVAEGKRRFQSIVGLVLVIVFFSLLMLMFSVKMHGYPYSFIFK